ncbi:hypothetical protein BHE74_00001231 [Ensete ventricosum]|nr:hypothetical protein BHE74_00001231 [Ensete ventricosum]
MADSLSIDVPWIMCQQADAPQPMVNSFKNWGSPDPHRPAEELAFQNGKSNATIDFEGSTYFLPAWSVSILPDCKSEAYNTAKVKTQTWLMVKKRNTAMEASEILYWSWRPERLGASAKGFGSTFTVNNLLEQKSVTLDESDYLWYHVPRSFLKHGEPNTLLLFEEAGGNPLQVNFQTVTVGAACASASEGETLSLSCHRGSTISSVDFASFEEPKGTCGAFEGGEGCSSDEAFAVVKDSCLGKESCSIEITEEFGKSCGTLPSPRKLAVQVTC